MKKFILIGLVAVGALLAVSAPAQNGFRAGKTLVVATPGVLLNATSTTNNPVDILGFTGIGTLSIFTATNGGGTLTCTLETSPDTTNWTAAANFAVITSATTINITNMYYGGTNLVATNNYLLPYTLTTPSASAGFVTPYPAYNAMTNTGAITVTRSGAYQVGINLTDNPRYIHTIWTATAQATNAAVGAILNGQRID